MSKKQKIKKTKQEKKKKEKIQSKDFQLEEILKQEENQEEKTEKKKISSLKEIKQIDLDTFEDLFEISDRPPPVLNRVGKSEEKIVLERGVSNAQRFQNSRGNEDDFKYVSGEVNQDNKKYISSSAHMTGEIGRLDFEKIGREKSKAQEAQFMQSPELQGIQNLNQEKYTEPERINPQDLGRENAFGKREIKKKKMDYEPLH